MKRNPIEISNYVKEEFAEYISSTYVVDDPDYQEQIDKELKTVDLFNGPYLNTSLPFTKGSDINELVRAGVLSAEFLKLSGIDFNRKLYSHQIEAIEKVKKGSNLVITTGTGSGKTESFLYPILNYIMKLIESGNKKLGVKAIFLYPMNALVNDQKDRIRSILKDYPQITFGSFTGETPHERNAKSLAELGIFDENSIPKNELISRAEIRKNPPDLLFTNYSMLEYLLIRPEDYSIISPRRMKDWQFIVLDEAHTYKGSLGIELSFLMRRLTGLVNRNPQFILTSATLGDQKSVGDIVKFAENLTSTTYREEDIVFAKRTKLNVSNIKYQIDPNQYVQISKNLKNLNELKNICSGFIDVNSCNDAESVIYRVLNHDKNTYLLYSAINGTRRYDEVKSKISESINISDEELVALIQLVSLANEDGYTLFDAKFHMFISAPNRAFITLGKEKAIKFGNYTTINGYKAFEIGACKNCDHLYLIGNIVNGYLEPDDSVDVYENYEEAMNQKLNFFVLEDHGEFEELEPYKLCSKCGKIVELEDINALGCDCGDEHLVDVYRINNDNSAKKNNLVKCACCGQDNTSGILRSFRLNKDSATAVLSQIYYEAMGETEKNAEVSIEIDDLFSFSDTVEEEKKDVKQLLAFSDSRQQASFFSTFFNYNQERFLSRRIIWEQLKGVDKIPVKSLASKLTSLIKEESLFDLAGTSAQSKAWISILMDILVTDGHHDSEGIGLYSYSYDYSDQLDRIKALVPKIQSMFGLSYDEFITLINVVIGFFRKNSAIDYQIAELSDQEKKDAFQYTDHEKYITLRKSQGDASYQRKFILSFVPYHENKPNQVTAYIMKVCNCSLPTAIKHAEALLALMSNLNLLKKSTLEGMTVYQLVVDRFVAQAYQHSKWYVCDKCKKITRYNAKNVCPGSKCIGHLNECDVDSLYRRNYYRKQYMNKQIEKISISEHTAQLSRPKGREVQKAFKDKKLNILSCSTTFEMGVDIGSLENVFLRNVPPSPANYVQRAGRAGRSKDAAALILTYCGNTSHDFAYFSNPTEMIEGKINPPMFNVTNEKIVLRHILASAFGFFFRSNEEYAKDIKKLIYDDSMRAFKDYLNSKPRDLGEYVDKKILYSGGFDKYVSFGWLDDVLDSSSKLELFIGEMTDKLNVYKEANQKAKDEDNLKLAQYFKDQIDQMETESVISTLSRYAVIPKYGFPVDVVDLDVMGNVGKNEDYNLQRDLSVAISEYAPDSEVVVDNNKYVSRYINTPRKNAGHLPRYYYNECPHCKQTVISLTPDNELPCPNCGRTVYLGNSYFIIPELGFSTDRTQKRSRTTRPKKTYAGAVKYIGGGTEEEKINLCGGKINISQLNNDQLVVLNEHKFFYCHSCGYSKVKDDTVSNVFTEKNNHFDALGYQCPNKKLERVALGHIFKTDVIKLKIHGLFSRDALVTFTYALLEGMSKTLQIERNDINGLVKHNHNFEFEIVLFDNVPGGAGHVKRIANDSTMYAVLNESLNILNQKCCDDETTCNKCLRNYYNQAHHRIMKKKYAKEIIQDLIGGEI